MGLVYVPQTRGKGATSGNIRNFNPKLAGGYSRIGTIIKGGIAGYRFVRANYKFFTGLGSVIAGSAITFDKTGVDLTEKSNSFQETYRTIPARHYSNGHRNRYSCHRSGDHQLEN